ncbi:MAG: hypothetical protein CMC18_03695 [Flavobacteriaceae bacterium]|nr:hypothetical protein [Flavobacteriaceae bacterium]
MIGKVEEDRVRRADKAVGRTRDALILGAAHPSRIHGRAAKVAKRDVKRPEAAAEHADDRRASDQAAARAQPHHRLRRVVGKPNGAAAVLLTIQSHLHAHITSVSRHLGRCACQIAVAAEHRTNDAPIVLTELATVIGAQRGAERRERRSIDRNKRLARHRRAARRREGDHLRLGIVREWHAIRCEVGRVH